MNRLGLLSILGLAFFASGCSKKADTPTLKATVKVHGVVTVNGAAPPWKVQLEARPVGEIDSKNPTVSMAETQEDGSFEFTTYSSGDGVPAGSYAVLAKSQVYTTLIMGGNEPPDKLGRKYDTVAKSPHKFEVKEGDEPVDLGTIDLVGSKKK